MEILWILIFLVLVALLAYFVACKFGFILEPKVGGYHRMLDNAVKQGGKSNVIGADESIHDYIQYGGAEGTGIVFESGTKEAKKEVKDVKAEGVTIIKNAIVSGDVDVKGTLELRNSEVKGKISVVGSLLSVGSNFGDLSLNGHGDVFRSEAGKISLCGKLKSKKSNIKQIDFSKSCKVGDMRAPFISLSETPVGKIVLPSGLKEEEIVKIK